MLLHCKYIKDVFLIILVKYGLNILSEHEFTLFKNNTKTKQISLKSNIQLHVRVAVILNRGGV